MKLLNMKLVMLSLLALILMLATAVASPLAMHKVAACEPAKLCPDEYRWSEYHDGDDWVWDATGKLLTSWKDVHFVNSGPGDAYNVIATITYVPANVTILDGVVALGNIPENGGAWSTDFFQLVVDMNNPQSPEDVIQWRLDFKDASGLSYTVRNVPKFCGEEATIGDFVWIDSNQNGIQDAGEAGKAGVKVKLYDNLNYLVATTTTNATGYYGFTVTPGKYYVEFVKPAGYTFSPKDQGGDNAKDSDADTSTGKTDWLLVYWKTIDLTWDAGLYKVINGGCTRTPGFWQTHLDFTTYIFNNNLGGDINIGWRDINNIPDLMGIFWASPAKNFDGSKRTKLCQAKEITAFQAVAALLNSGLPNGAPLPVSLVQIQTIMGGSDIKAIQALGETLDNYNNKGDDVPIVSPISIGNANPKSAQAIANEIFADCP